MRLVTVVAVAIAIAASLQGCGGGATTTTAAPSPPTPAPTTAAPPPAPPASPSPPGPIKPLRGICYGALPNRNAPTGDPIPARDEMQSGYDAQWSPEGRDDLGLIHTMGGNAVRTYHSLGLETLSKYDHGKFLDRAVDVGVHVIAGYHTQMSCDNFDCYDSWKAATLAAYDQGFLKDGKWHPAVSILSLAEEPDDLNFQGSTVGDCNERTNNMCWLRAIISAMDGVLAAEKEKGIAESRVNMTVAWSSASRDSFDGQKVGSIGIYGFYDLFHAIKDPKKIANYEPVNDVKQAYDTRWVNSVNANSNWDFIQGKILPEYKEFEPTPWFIAGFTTNNQDDTVAWNKDITTMDTLAKTTSFLGVAIRGLQRRYEIPGGSDGLFSLGKKTSRIQTTEDVCEEDVNSHSQNCHKYTVNCLCAQLETKHGGNRAAPLATVWGGIVSGPGVCYDYGNALCPGVPELQEATVA